MLVAKLDSHIRASELHLSNESSVHPLTASQSLKRRSAACTLAIACFFSAFNSLMSLSAYTQN